MASSSVPLGVSASSADYLIPLARSRPPSGTSINHIEGATGGGGERERVGGRNDSTTSLQEHCGYWETSFTREGVKAIARGEPLPDVALATASSSSTGNLSMSSNSMKRRRSKGYAVVSTYDSKPSTSTGLNQSQSTQPLLETPPDSPSAKANVSNGTINNLPDQESVTLDASNLCRQSYANIRIAATANSNSSPPTKGERNSTKQNEISC